MSKKIKKGDQVIVISGSDKGKSGKIINVSGDRVVVEGVALATIHKKPTTNNPGQIIKSERSIHISNISHLDGGVPSKIKFSLDADCKERVFKKSGRKVGQSN